MKDVAFSCDDNGAKFLRVTVWSLLKHYKGDEPIRINVFEGFGGHSAENKKKLQSIVDEFNEKKLGVEKRCRCRMEGENASLHLGSTPTPAFCSLRYINVEKAIEPYADLIMHREKSRWNVFTWTPIFTPMLLADATGNVAHFDIDMLFNDDVSKILDLDLGDNLIAAVAEYGKGDRHVDSAIWGTGIVPPEVERYFNTGTLVFNTVKCRAERTWEKLLEWYRANYAIAERIEQDAWNALYHDRVMLLPLRWNFHDRLMRSYPRWNPADRYWLGNPPRDCLTAALNPAILHFWGPKKPWNPSHRPYRKLYHAAMRAVGLVPPRDQRFSFLRDISNARIRRRIKRMWLKLSPDFGYYVAYQRRERRKRIRKAFVSSLAWLAVLLILPPFLLLPRRLMVAVCDVISRLYFVFDRTGRKRAEENLDVVLGVRGRSSVLSPAGRERIIRRSYRNMVRCIGYLLWTSFNGRKRVAATMEITRDVKVALKDHRPSVMVSGHIGYWEMLSQLACLEGHRMMSVSKDIGIPVVMRFLVNARRSVGQEIVYAAGAFKPLMQGIRDGKSLGLLVDQKVNPKYGGIWVRFFGRPMPVSAAPAFFAAKAKAPIITAWARPLDGGRQRCEMIRIYSPEEARDIWRMTQRCAHDLERIIRRHPSCWILNYNYFSTEPTSEEIAALKERESRS